ncbi:MAG: toxin-antitoxin system YwqK family antitoxin [Candidatus Binataceae bacterium]
MKLKSTLPILALAAALAACKSVPPCPPGTQLRGEGPPNGSEIACVKTVNGKEVKDGPFILYSFNGSKTIQGYYRDGKQDGEWTMWYDNGQKKSVDRYQGGVQEGKHVSWYSNGRLDAKGQYKNGEKAGVWKRWDQYGFKNWEETYKDGKKIS